MNPKNLTSLISHKTSAINRQGTKAPTLTDRAQRLLQYPIGLEGTYDNQ